MSAGLLNVIVTGLVIGLPLLGLPAAILTYVCLKASQRRGGRRGLRVGASICVAAALVPVLLVTPVFLSVLSGTPVYGDVLKTAGLAVAASLSLLTGVGAMCLFRWRRLAAAA